MAEAKFRVGDEVQIKRGRGWSKPCRIEVVGSPVKPELRGPSIMRYLVSCDNPRRWHSEDKIRFSVG